MEDLLEQLADYLLHSGFQYPYHDREEGRSLQELYAALLQALAEQGQIDGRDLEQWLDSPEFREQSELSGLLEALLQRLVEEGYITLGRPGSAEEDLDIRGYVGGFGPETKQARFEITNKALDFLGYKTLRDLLGALGKSDLGRHDTRELSTGIEAALPPKPYEFGDSLNLDVTTTLLNAIERQGLAVPIEIEYRDLAVRQSDYQSSCATVLLLDCSHSMILYGEDRFTPAKRVALALSHLIRTQYPGDSLHMVLFHDSAEEIPLSRLARVTVGPYHTNTKAGLRLAQQILTRERKDMRQIVMITDGKPSAMTLADGRIYKNPAGLDPRIIHETFREVVACRRAGILINTFMLARDYDLVAFVQKVTEIARGKAYFTTPYTLGQYLLMDYMSKKLRHIH
ncbi:MAG TPA: VWA domain-containing protein [Candidatus Methylomirabilis sp.]|nr:VWA domain-containing protein [Candidatus Methylomirabilis sp.]